MNPQGAVDFFSWFVGKHYLVSAVLFPELTLAWAVWMRWYGFALILSPVIAFRLFHGAVERARGVGLMPRA